MSPLRFCEVKGLTEGDIALDTMGEVEREVEPPQVGNGERWTTKQPNPQGGEEHESNAPAIQGLVHTHTPALHGGVEVELITTPQQVEVEITGEGQQQSRWTTSS